METELISKLNFLEDEDREASPAMSNNPFDDPDDDLHPNHLNPFGDPDEEGMLNSLMTQSLFYCVCHFICACMKKLWPGVEPVTRNKTSEYAF